MEILNLGCGWKNFNNFVSFLKWGEIHKYNFDSLRVKYRTSFLKYPVKSKISKYIGKQVQRMPK